MVSGDDGVDDGESETRATGLAGSPVVAATELQQPMQRRATKRCLCLEPAMVTVVIPRHAADSETFPSTAVLPMPGSPRSTMAALSDGPPNPSRP